MLETSGIETEDESFSSFSVSRSRVLLGPSLLDAPYSIYVGKGPGSKGGSGLTKRIVHDKSKEKGANEHTVPRAYYAHPTL